MTPCSSDRPHRLRLAKAAFGFAYLWLLFTVAAVGLSLSLAAELYTTSTQRDKEKELLAIGRQFRQAIGHYYEMQGQGTAAQYPPSLEELLQDPRSLTPKRHLRKIFVDPMTGKAEWGLFKVGSRVAGVYSLSEKVPIKQGNFEADDAVFTAKQKYSEWVFTYPADLVLRVGSNNGAAPLPAVAVPPPNSTLPGSSQPPVVPTPLPGTSPLLGK